MKINTTTQQPHPLANRSVSHGTMRTQDLIPAFMGTLRELDWANYLYLSNEYTHAYLPFLPPDDDDWWSSDDCMECLNTLFDKLDALAPEGYYFGAHPGDGSDYGFWECED